MRPCLNAVHGTCHHHSMELTDVIALAKDAHAGQVDKQGRDYFDAHLTPIAEAATIFGPHAEAAGWLHDIIEDTDTTASQLLELGVDAEVVGAVESVTRSETETYEELISRSCSNRIGCAVKLADNAWNIASNPALARVDPERAQAMLADRYEPARARLLGAAGLTLDSPEYTEMLNVFETHLARLAD